MKRTIYFLLLVIIIINPLLTSGQEKSGNTSNYHAVNGAIVGNNTGRYNNRPLYINNSNAFVLTGDQPIGRMAQDQYVYGTFMLAIVREGKAKWLQQCDQIISIYNPGRMSWEMSDKAFPGLKIILEMVPMASTTGMAVKVNAQGTEPGDKLIWTFGGAQWRKNQNLSWKFDVMGQPELLTWGFVSEDCSNNKIEISGKTSFVSLMDSTSTKKLFTVAGSCSSSGVADAGDASEWSNAAVFEQSKANRLPILKGTVILDKTKTIYWAFEAFTLNRIDNPDLSQVNNSENAFSEGIKRTESFQSRLKINTPDAYLNAVAAASVAAVDGTWYPPVFVHGGMQWNMRFPGWRTIFGGTMYGWHDRVKDQAKFYCDSQIKTSDKKEAKADPATLLTGQHPDSRFYGVGRISMDQNFYNMQTQFFDQIVEEYRWTADPNLGKFFREALELHLIWVRDCFDPDGDGVYESYINSWPSDSQWYNGGGTAEETSYAYRGHLAARDMARNAGDAEAEKYHNLMLEKIKKGFFEMLWIQQKGHSGAYREQGGHERLHEDPWLYSIFLPIDVGLTSPLQSIESVYYTEWALQNDRMPYGGRQVWASNWVPSIWSVRELWPGDNYHLALSYFKSGLPNDGYDIFRGTFLRTAFNHLSPGNLGGVQGGVDFGDCTHTFTRTLVSGLFGYHPDYPNGNVEIAPQFPTEWNHASIEIPDVKIAFNREGNKINYSIKLNRLANINLVLPVSGEGINNVTVNGVPVKWELLAGVGLSLININLPQSDKADVVIELKKSLPYYAAVFLEGNVGEIIKISTKDARIISVEDPQSVFEQEKLENGMLTAKLSSHVGFHTIVALVKAGEAPQTRVFRIKVNDPAGVAKEAARYVSTVPANAKWENINISSLFNADITTVYQQKYLEPRTNTVSVRLGTDGYSPWTFPYWGGKPPTIKLDNVKKMLNDQSCFMTQQGVSFLWNAGEKNISFTSMWNNYPKKIEFPVNKKGDAIYFLIAGSTNVMQCQIANAVIRLYYADGQTDSLELIPPVNYWNLSPISPHPTGPGQISPTDYTIDVNRFCLPEKLPEVVVLGENCRAMLLNLKLRAGVELKSISLETLSQEVVVGLLGITVMSLK